jgi:tight adherence protein B
VSDTLTGSEGLIDLIGSGPVAAACGAVVGLGATLLVLGVRGVERPVARPVDGPGWRERVARWRHQRMAPRLAGAIVAGLLAGLFTGWPAATVLAGLAVWALPSIAGPDRDHARQVARIEAVAVWAEMLRDTLASAAGLQQAILATAQTAPGAIRTEVLALRDRIENGQRLADALRGFARDLADPTGDLVVVALVQASERQARNLGDLLGALATSARDQATMRLRVAAGRARTRTAVRTIVGGTVAMAVGLVLINRTYLDPYDTLAGQLVLSLIGGMFAAGLFWLDRIARPKQAPRVLAGDGRTA